MMSLYLTIAFNTFLVTKFLKKSVKGTGELANSCQTSVAFLMFV
jgi:hypothetical protein